MLGQPLRTRALALLLLLPWSCLWIAGASAQTTTTTLQTGEGSWVRCELQLLQHWNSSVGPVHAAVRRHAHPTHPPVRKQTHDPVSPHPTAPCAPRHVQLHKQDLPGSAALWQLQVRS
jgi:hypothetical protein